MPRLKERLTKLIALRLSDEQYDKVAARAAARKQTVSAAIRDLIKEAS